ncbi:MAG: hypothetical protein PHD15_01530 [Clostridia bacterium]|nr:hypothetical protein [Clostridia bacterium]MDD4386431.1 hypothetical protein [Clostridia bacterium]
MKIKDIDMDKLKVSSELRDIVEEALKQIQENFDKYDWNDYIKDDQIQNIYNYAFGFLDNNATSEYGQVDYDDMVVNFSKEKIDLATVKHEIMHILTGQKIKQGVKNQGVKQIYSNGKFKGRAMSEGLNEYICGENGKNIYGDYTHISKLTHLVLGEKVIEAQIAGDRTILEDKFYDTTGSDEVLNDIDASMESPFFGGMDKEQNETYMLRPGVLLIETYIIKRKKEFKSGLTTSRNITQIVEDDEKMFNELNSTKHEMYSKISTNILKKELQDLYRDETILEGMDSYAAEKLVKYSSTKFSENLEHIDFGYIQGAMDGGTTLYNEYIDDLKDMIESGEFENSEKGVIEYVKTMRNFNENCARHVCINKELVTDRECGIEGMEFLHSGDECYDLPEISELNNLLAEQLLGNKKENLLGILNGLCEFNIPNNNDLYNQLLANINKSLENDKIEKTDNKFVNELKSMVLNDDELRWKLAEEEVERQYQEELKKQKVIEPIQEKRIKQEGNERRGLW